MASDDQIHIVSLTSFERAEQARACYALGYHAEIYSNYNELIASRPSRGIVLAEDITDRGGIGALLAEMADHGLWMPVIATAASAELGRVVGAIRSGAIDYLTLPLERDRLFAALNAGLAEAQTKGSAQRKAVEARARLAMLTPRESDVLELLVAGSSNKMIARELEISPRTVEIHRANMMAKLGANHAADAVRLRLEAGMIGRGGDSLANSARLARG